MWSVLSALAAAQPTQAAIDAASWRPLTTRKNDAGEVAVFEASIAGLTCFRGEVVAALPVDALLAAALDIPGCTRWSTAGVRESVVLARGGDWIEYYQYLDVPNWTMASDRFWFLRLTHTASPTKGTIRWDRMGERGGTHNARYEAVAAANPSAVEPVINVGNWTFEVGPTGTRVDYRVCTNPGGSIPVMVQNAATKQTLPDTVADVVREATRRNAQ
jgi:predicted DNA-binding WGR domain protein